MSVFRDVTLAPTNLGVLNRLNCRHGKSSEAVDPEVSGIVGVETMELSTANWDVTIGSQITRFTAAEFD
jgi:hypothetical protein